MDHSSGLDDTDCKSSIAFTEALVEQVNKNDVNAMVLLQREMLSRYEKTNEMLINFNMLSSARFEATSEEFRKHTLLLYEMKRDLNTIFKRIRVLKQRLGKLYPEAFSVCSDVYDLMDEEDEEENTATLKDQNKDTKPNS